MHECDKEKRILALENSDATLKERLNNLIDRIEKNTKVMNTLLITVVSGLIVTIVGGFVLFLLTMAVTYLMSRW